MPTPSGHQTTATFSWHGKLLPPVFAQLCTSFETFNRSHEGGAKTLKRTASAQEAFQNAKRLLAAAVPLQHPAPNAKLSLATDASDTHIGGVMQQKSGDHWRPLGFFSRELTDSESRYSTFDRKLLAARAAIKHFCHFGEG